MDLVRGTAELVDGEFFETSTGNSLKLQQPVTTQLRTTMDALRPKQTSHHPCPHIYLWNCKTAGLYSFAMTPIATPCSTRTMDPSEFWSELPSISHWTSMVNATQCPLIGLIKPAFLDADWGLCEEPGTPPPPPPPPHLHNQLYIHAAPSTVVKKISLYIRLITRVSVRYGEIFHEPKASEISCHISQLTSVISALFL